jgi:hypothetical protein
MPTYPIGMYKQFKFLKMPPLELLVFVQTHSCLLFPPVACVFTMTQLKCANLQFFLHISHWLQEVHLVEGLHYNTRDSGFDSHREFGNFTVTYSFCLHSVALTSTQPKRNEYLGISLRLQWGQCVEMTTLSS